MMELHWERGYRCWGYWHGLKRYGFVGLPAHCFGPVTEYTWSFDKHTTCPTVSGKAKTLRQAKREVERAYAEHFGGNNADHS